MATVGLAESQDGELIEYLIVPTDALTRYRKNEGKNEPPSGPDE